MLTIFLCFIYFLWVIGFWGLVLVVGPILAAHLQEFGVYPPNDGTPELLSAIQALSAYTPEGTTLAYSTTDGLGWVDSRGWQVFFGQTQDDMAVKQSTYQALVAQLEAEGVAPKMISVANVHAPYYRGE